MPPHEQFARWCDVVASSFVPVALERPGDGPFRASVRSHRIGPVTIARISSQAQRMMRTSALVDRHAGDIMVLNLLLRGTATARQDGHEAHLRPNDFLVFDSTRPFEQRFDGNFDQLSFVVPMELAAARLARPSAVTALRIAGDSGLGAIVSATLRTLAAQAATIDGPRGRSAAVHAAELAVLALAHAASGQGTHRRGVLRQAALDAVERDLADPGLCPDRVARDVNVSVRSLHQLFADHGTTFGRWVLRRRLARCHLDLADPGWDHLTIAQIATRWGFRDQSHFARSFRARYGHGPREYRRAPRR